MSQFINLINSTTHFQVSPKYYIFQSIRQTRSSFVKRSKMLKTVAVSFTKQLVPGAGGASGSSWIGTDTFFSGVISLGTSGTLKILGLLTIKNLKNMQDFLKSRQKNTGRGFDLTTNPRQNSF